MDSAEFAEMIAAEGIGPPVWVRMVCQQLAVLTSIVFNRTRGKDEAAMSALSFLPWKEQKPEQSVEELMMVCEALSMQTFGES